MRSQRRECVFGTPADSPRPRARARKSADRECDAGVVAEMARQVVEPASVVPLLPEDLRRCRGEHVLLESGARSSGGSRSAGPRAPDTPRTGRCGVEDDRALPQRLPDGSATTADARATRGPFVGLGDDTAPRPSGCASPGPKLTSTPFRIVCEQRPVATRGSCNVLRRPRRTGENVRARRSSRLGPPSQPVSSSMAIGYQGIRATSPASARAPPQGMSECRAAEPPCASSPLDAIVQRGAPVARPRSRRARSCAPRGRRRPRAAKRFWGKSRKSFFAART
jgi:hypothetical protein